MKGFFKIILMLLCLLCLLSCQSEQGPKAETNENKVQVINDQRDGFSTEEKEMGITLHRCADSWRSLISESFEKSEAEALALGIIARNCLKIENTRTLLSLLRSFSEYHRGKKMNWNLLGKNILNEELL